MRTRQYVIFRCEKEDCWIVSVIKDGDVVALGVAECPDEGTARRVRDAMQLWNAWRTEGNEELS